MSRPRIGICHAPNAAANLREIVVSATGWCEPVVLVRQTVAEEFSDYVRVARRILECHVLPPGSEELVAGQLGLDGITTFHDDELDLTARLQEALGGTGGDAASPWDKYEQRKALAEASIDTVRAVPVDSPAMFVAAVSELGAPCLVKPRRGAGGVGIAHVRDDADVRHQLEHRRNWSGLVVEEMIPTGRHPSGIPWLADYVSVETASAGSTRRHLAILDKLPVSVTRRAGADGADLVCVTGDVYPSTLPVELVSLALSTVDQILDVLGVRSRMTHTELKLTPDGFELIEVNGRLAGHTSRLTRLTGGPDLVRAALQATVGVLAESASAQRGVACGMFPRFRDRVGPVRSDVSRTDVRSLPGVRGVDEVATRGAPRGRGDGRIVNLIVHAESWQRLDADVRAVAHGLRRLFDRDPLADEPFAALSPVTGS